jgi:hypothetical protein
MSARALLNNLRVIEIPMSYEERIGRSKLNVLRDGVRFLRAIGAGVLSYSPERPFLAGFVLCMFVTAVLATSPTEFYLANRRLEEWMVYRFVVCYVLASFGLLLLLATTLVHRMAILTPRRSEAIGFWPSVVAGVFSGAFLYVTILLLLGLSVLFLWPGLVEYGATRHVSLHWSRLLAGAFSLSAAFQVMIFGLLLNIISVWSAQREYARAEAGAAPQRGDLS